jgi:hypothetical protein
VPDGGRAATARINRTQADPARTTQGGDEVAALDPSRAGLNVDFGRHLDWTGGHPVDPVTRLMSLFTDHETGFPHPPT